MQTINIRTQQTSPVRKPASHTLFLRHAAFLILVCTAFLFHITASHALGVEKLRFNTDSEKVRLVLELDKPSEFRAFMLDTPYRLVIDLPEFTWRAGLIERTKQAGVLDIRQGNLQPGYSRIVFDLTRAAGIKNAFNLTEIDNSGKIVIDYTPISPAEFSARKDKIFGKLSLTPLTPALALPQEQKFTPPTPPLPPTQREPTQDSIANHQYKPLIVIDPGHGGIDPGAVGQNKTYEKDIVLALGFELKKLLLDSGRYRVMMTRESDVFIKLRDRVSFARSHGADLFISIHADSTTQKDTRGTSIYTLSKKASDEQTARLAEKENKADLVAGIDLSVEDEQVAYILGDFLMTDTMNQSKFFANTLVATMKKSPVKLLQNPHRYAGFAVLKAPDIPSVLVEAGFISNPTESKLLTQKEHRSNLANALLQGIHTYFEQVKKHDLVE